MKGTAGATAGVLLGFAGVLVGVYFAWHGFSSAPYNNQMLGEFWGAMGTVLGCSSALIGTLYERWRKQARQVVPGVAA